MVTQNMTIAVVATCVGTPYHQFLNEWIDAIMALERRPDEVVVSTDLVEEETTLPNGLIRYIPVTQESKNGHWGSAVNEAIAMTTSDWICKVDIDDLILPHALNELDSCKADVYSFGLKYGEQNLYAPYVNAEIILNHRSDPGIFSNSPYRRSVWEANPYEDIVYGDAVFWYAAAIKNATFAISSNIDYIYRIHDGQVTKRTDHFESMASMYQRKQELMDVLK